MILGLTLFAQHVNLAAWVAPDVFFPVLRVPVPAEIPWPRVPAPALTTLMKEAVGNLADMQVLYSNWRVQRHFESVEGCVAFGYVRQVQ
jgi:hypothetical protein